MTDTVATLLRRLDTVDDRGMRFEDSFVPWRSHVALSHDRAALLRDILDVASAAPRRTTRQRAGVLAPARGCGILRIRGGRTEHHPAR